MQSISDEAIAQMISQRAREARVPATTPHDLRRTTATHLLQKNVDYGVVSAMLGHASLGTTRRYDLRGEDAKIQASGQLHVPYAGRRR